MRIPTRGVVCSVSACHLLTALRIHGVTGKLREHVASRPPLQESSCAPFVLQRCVMNIYPVSDRERSHAESSRIVSGSCRKTRCMRNYLFVRRTTSSGNERRPGHQWISGRRRASQSEFQTLATATIVQWDLLYIHNRGDAL